MSYSYDRRTERRVYSSFPGPSNRTTLGYWVPLIVIGASAVAGVAAWVWSERRDADDGADIDYGSSSDADYANRLARERKAMADGARPAADDDGGDNEQGTRTMIDEYGNEVVVSDETFMSRVGGIYRRTPSPQQIFDGASKRLAAGMAMVGKGLKSIQEEQRDDYGDHERWSEEAESRDVQTSSGTAAATLKQGAAAGAGAALARDGQSSASKTAEKSSSSSSRLPKRTVAVVVSADQNSTFSQDTEDDSYHIEHASILSHLVGYTDVGNVNLIILVYAPHLTAHPLSKTPRRPSSSGASSYSNIDAADAATTDNDEPSNALYDALMSQARALVGDPTHIIPFTTSTGHLHLLRHLSPSLVYLEESLAGSAQGGEIVSQIDGWVGQTVVVVGAEGAGIADTETEDEAGSPGAAKKKTASQQQRRWWADDARVGLGKGVEIVDAMRVGDDWAKRVAPQ